MQTTKEEKVLLQIQQTWLMTSILGGLWFKSVYFCCNILLKVLPPTFSCVCFDTNKICNCTSIKISFQKTIRTHGIVFHDCDVLIIPLVWIVFIFFIDTTYLEDAFIIFHLNALAPFVSKMPFKLLFRNPTCTLSPPFLPRSFYIILEARKI
jgi:hypothetical protein